MTEKTMVERVARKIAMVRIPSYADDKLWDEHWAWYLRGRGEGGTADASTLGFADRQAREAIAEMREPSEAMTESASYLAGEWSRRNVEAFIDEALK